MIFYVFMYLDLFFHVSGFLGVVESASQDMYLLFPNYVKRQKNLFLDVILNSDTPSACGLI